ncbi:hypothetical protein G6F65_020545 [Rhizopus arrhizus]|nr:hypothetical protein G6F65_020545 [Rhizopus arrhizus]
MLGGQVFVAVTQVILAELRGVVALAFQGLRNRDVPVLQSYGGTRDTDFRQAGAARRLPGNEGGPARRATVFSVVVGENRAFIGDTIDIGRSVAHDPSGVGADVGLPHVIPKNDKNVRLLAGGFSNPYIRFHSVFMSTTVHPLRWASSNARSNRPTLESRS